MKYAFFITKGNIEEIKRLIMPEHWIYDKDYSIERQKLIPESVLNTKDVGVTVWRRERKCEYFPSPDKLTIGWEKTDGLSYLGETELDELPQKLHHLCRCLCIRIDGFINEPFYECGQCGYNNKYSPGPCYRCCGQVIPIDKFGVEETGIPLAQMSFSDGPWIKPWWLELVRKKRLLTPA